MKRKNFLSGIAAFILALSAFVAQPMACAEEKTQITFGYNPSENNDIAVVNGKKFSEYFKKKIGLNVKTFVATDYTALVEAMRSGQIDFAWMPPFSFIKAETIAGALPLLKAVYLGHAVLYGGIIVRSDSPYYKIEDLKGKNIAWVDPSSSSGHIMPKASLIRHKKIDPDKFFGRQIFAGAHDAVILAVLNGTVDAGATYMATPDGVEGAWTHYLTRPEDMKKIRVIFASDPITSDLVTTTKKMLKEHKEIVDKMTKILGEMSKDPEGKRLLKDLYKVDDLIPAASADYEPLRDAARVLQLNY